jgi:hypothetical protein
MNLNLQSPSIARVLFKVPEGVLVLPWKFPENLLALMRKKLGRYFPIFDKNPKNLHNITWTSCEAQRNFSQPSFIKRISINPARGKTELSFYSLYKNYINKIIVI